MKNKVFTLTFVIFAALTGVYAQQPNTGSAFCSPVDIPILLSGSYGELRSTHFHAGIDIKTQQTEGKNVLAAAEGYVYRIVVQTDGYGKALYLRHPGGKITVYAHLSMFSPAVEAYVKENQYRRKSFELDLYPEAGKFSYKCGEQIGLSGNTGSSEGPHLHFEVRDRSGSVPLNPLNYGFAIADKTKPRISGLFIYNLVVSDRSKKVIAKTELSLTGNNGHYRLTNDTVTIAGPVGIGIETYDYFDQSTNQ
ncbi:MAG: M23 family metallopeptidase, partial [Bacteroidales bacterium]|nr:M23 family metallopeptidase [Bacteroidales bacterium]